MQDKIQEIMGLVDDIIGCDSAGYQFECKREIESKLRELVREPMQVQYPEGYDNPFARVAYDAGWHAAERSHNITNTSN